MMAFTERGQGSVLLFIHAFPLDSSMWQAQTQFFSKRYRVITPDILGFGRSQPPRAWTMPQMGEELLNLLDTVKIDTCALIGLSIGGYISLPFTLAHPGRVRCLVLAHTRARADLEAERAARTAMIEELQKDGIASLPGKMLPRLLGPMAPAQAKDQVRTSIEKVSAEAAIHAVTAMRDRADQTGNLARLPCPTLVVSGSDDAIIKAEDSKTMASEIPGGEFVVIPGTGHLSNIEAPDAFNEALNAFLARRYSE